MADEREGQGLPAGHPATEDKVQTRGREANAARPLNAAEDKGGAERYPSVSQTDSVERRSFDPAADAPTPRQGAGDGSIPVSKTEAQLGPGGDPVEGKR
ncbi:hypothetical protein DJ021_05295 [Phenylobacterium hankyongense]|uniref:Uncharacterized protein n=1 Tax=Phenylobacterium hankyongense TaxID=1813876 RepID=A0A328AXC2_9CAUL|nr:hypothetical protein [Phenylobacterium hankyongense]RAK59257.1 hypothetical protein DJ021_05295 [Phenylobacterium hankyongense]